VSTRSFPFFFHLLHAIERPFVWFSLHGEKEIYASADFPWVRELERNWRAIRSELEQVLAHRNLIPNFQEISPEQAEITRDDKWKAHVFYAYGVKAGRNCRESPVTASLLASVPGIKTAFFSILSGGKHIPSHRGPYKGLLRCHLGLVVPGPADACRIRVGRSEARWREGQALVFDDTFMHEVWNDSPRERVVLFIDFLRPMRFPMSWINRVILQLVVRSPYGRRIVRNFAQWYERRGIKADV
jgi:ornithine lipid ester-linked acyl 2-hydroxylase